MECAEGHLRQNCHLCTDGEPCERLDDYVSDAKWETLDALSAGAAKDPDAPSITLSRTQLAAVAAALAAAGTSLGAILLHVV